MPGFVVVVVDFRVVEVVVDFRVVDVLLVDFGEVEVVVDFTLVEVVVAARVFAVVGVGGRLEVTVSGWAPASDPSRTVVVVVEPPGPIPSSFDRRTRSLTSCFAAAYDDSAIPRCTSVTEFGSRLLVVTSLVSSNWGLNQSRPPGLPWKILTRSPDKPT